MPKKTLPKTPPRYNGKHLGGRPTKYNDAIGEKVYQLIIEGRFIKDICSEIGINVSTFFEWIRNHEAFSKLYAEAKEIQAEMYAEDMIKIAYDGTGDYGFKEAEDKDGQGAKPFFISENVQRSRLKVDTLKWIASKLKPKKYGDKVTNEHTGPDGGPLEVKGTVRFVK